MTLPLDQTRTARPPATWSAELVRQRLVEAFAIERRMPGQRFAVIASAWPATPVHEFQEIMHWEDARERVWDSWAKARGVYSYEVSRMEQSFSWLERLPEGERRCLAAWALCSARGLNVKRMIEKRRWSRTTFYRQIEKAAAHIADRLNVEGVQVR
jgi:hypothetical protein